MSAVPQSRHGSIRPFWCQSLPTFAETNPAVFIWTYPLFAPFASIHSLAGTYQPLSKTRMKWDFFGISEFHCLNPWRFRECMGFHRLNLWQLRKCMGFHRHSPNMPLLGLMIHLWQFWLFHHQKFLLQRHLQANAHVLEHNAQPVFPACHKTLLFSYKATSLSQKAEIQSKIQRRPSPSTLRSEHSRNQSTYNICIQPR